MVGENLMNLTIIWQARIKNSVSLFFGSPKILPNEVGNVGKIINGVDEVVLMIKPPKQK